VHPKTYNSHQYHESTMDSFAPQPNLLLHSHHYKKDDDDDDYKIIKIGTTKM
jgi:hypothetical protein